jgi:phosphopantothenoylcysteine decarboxylase/phosphopantothenate--cysteine ligase
MNRVMWENPATQANMRILNQRGIRIVGPGVGDQACGETGAGRMSEPLQILAAVTAPLPGHLLQGKRVLITAGPTREAIDPVRYISNRSSGKMGFALAAACAEAGAEVVLIAGPVSLATPRGVERQDAETAAQMLDAVRQALPGTHVFVATAAVADYRVAEPREQKIKKEGEHLQLDLVRNPDILAEVAGSSPRPELVVGFAAESTQLLDHARQKLERKRLDLIVANDISRPDTGFDVDENQVWLVDSTSTTQLCRMPKRQLADELVMKFHHYLSQK